MGVPVVDVCRLVRITEQSSYRWKKHFVGLEIHQARQLKQLAGVLPSPWPLHGRGIEISKNFPATEWGSGGQPTGLF